MVLIRFFLLYIAFLPQSVKAVLYNPAYYGEHDFEIYFGARDLNFQADSWYGQIFFEENTLYQNYITQLISPELVSLEVFFTKDFIGSIKCPQWEMDRMYDYLRYANRVLALSYLYEAARLQEETAQKLGEKNICRPNWREVLRECRPISQDMKTFIKNAKYVINDDQETVIQASHSLKKYIQQWESDYKNNKFKDVTHYRIANACKKEKCPQAMTYKEGMNILRHSCQKDLSTFREICSEKDHLFGMSEIQETYTLLATSDILTFFDDQGHALGCLQRYKQQNKSKEVRSELLKSLIPIVYQQMLQDGRRFPQGRLFSVGSLKQFVVKGLTDIYKDEKVIDETVPTPISDKKKVVLSKEDQVEFIDHFQKKKTKRRVKIVKPQTNSISRKSTFLLAVETQKQLDVDQVKVDMLKFKYDFLFSIQLKRLLDDTLHNYTTRSGLEQMKKADKLGTRQGPLPLMFLKYLIETQKHQSLYNIINTVGERFYVNNDIDSIGNKMASLIELKNDESTSNQWQITIIREPATE